MFNRLILFLLTVCLITGPTSRAIGGEINAHEVETGLIVVPNGQLYYEKTGSGAPMVMLHDGLVHHEVWNHQVEAFRDQYTCIRYDRRGFGKSPAPTEPFSQVDDCLAVFDSLGIDKAILIGMSAGGRLAIDFALAHPARVTHLVLCGAVASGMTFTEHNATRGGHRPPGIAADRDTYIAYWVETDPYEIYKDNKAARDETRAMMAAYPHNADFLKWRLEQPETPALGRMHEITAPALVAVGEYDMPDMHAHAGAISAAMPNAVRRVFRDAGHRLPMEQPEALNEAVVFFLDEAEFFGTLQNESVDAAVALYAARRVNDPGTVMFTEVRMNQTGYLYLQRGDTDDAVKLFRLNTIAYPGSGNVWDSYAEGLLTIGDTTAAITNYEKSLEVDPSNANATEVLERIR